jgi:hypothetical protein
MFRVRAPDYSTPKEELHEYLWFESEWNAKDYFGADLSLGEHHEEGKYVMQTRKLVNQIDSKTGRLTTLYLRGTAREAYSIPFTKQNVDKYLFGEHPFGPDSLNITDPEKVVFYGKITGMGVTPFRCNDYTYEQFVIASWHDFTDLAIQKGGPASRKLKESGPGHDAYIS